MSCMRQVGRPILTLGPEFSRAGLGRPDAPLVPPLGLYTTLAVSETHMHLSRWRHTPSGALSKGVSIIQKEPGSLCVRHTLRLCAGQRGVASSRPIRHRQVQERTAWRIQCWHPIDLVWCCVYFALPVSVALFAHSAMNIARSLH